MKSLACALAAACLASWFNVAGADAPGPPSDSLETTGSSAAGRAALALDPLIRSVLARNPTLASARAGWAEARARARQAGSLEAPMLDIMGAPRSFGSTAVDPAYRIGVTQAFPLFGQRGLSRRVAGAEADAMAWDLRTAQLDLVHAARLAYIDYWRIGRAIALNRELRQLLPEFRRISLARYSAGQVGQQEPLQVDAEIAMLDHEAVVLERRRLIAVATLNVLMHESPAASLSPAPDELPLPDTMIVHSDLAPHALAMRPEMRAADARLQASREQLTLADRARLPETSFGLAYDRFWTEPELQASVGLTMSLPISPGRVSAARDQARAQLASSQARREVVRDDIALQIAIAAARLHEQAHDVAIARERMLPLAERTLHAARASYEANRTDFLVVLNSLRDFLRTRLEADDSLAMLHEARADLDRALGVLPSGLNEEQTP